MNKFIIALAATTAIAAAAPAAAQYGGNVQLRTDQLQAQLQAGLRSGAISRAEAVPLREQLRALTRLERQYSRGGFTTRERRDLQNRMAHLRHGIGMAARDGGRYERNDRYDHGRYDRDCPPGLEKRDNGCLPPGQVGRDGGWDDDDRDDRRGSWVDRNRDGYDDRDRRIDEREWRMTDERYDDRYERDDDRYAGRDAPRGGIGGLIDSLTGGGGLRVGQRVSGDLGPVPSGYRDRYRDGGGVYYRSDGRAIYQIDARTDTVVRIYGLDR